MYGPRFVAEIVHFHIGRPGEACNDVGSVDISNAYFRSTGDTHRRAYQRFPCRIDHPALQTGIPGRLAFVLSRNCLCIILQYRNVIVFDDVLDLISGKNLIKDIAYGTSGHIDRDYPVHIDFTGIDDNRIAAFPMQLCNSLTHRDFLQVQRNALRIR